MHRLAPSFLTSALVLALAACNASSNGPGYKPGELGNGGFLFTCDDTVQCEKLSNDASKFPEAVSLGASFSVRYQVKSDRSGLSISLDDRLPDRGITVQTVGSEYLSFGPSGFVGLRPGFATLVSRDAAGVVVDYTILRVSQPDAIAVYDAADRSTSPLRIQSITLPKGTSRTYRAVARKDDADLAGALRVEWRSSDASVVSVDGVSGVKVTVVANKVGTATLTATGGSFTQPITVEVQP